MKYFEDIRVGERQVLGARTIELAAMLAFANEFDQQPIHTDEAAARNSIHKGLIASGAHTLAVTTALITDHYLGDKAMVAGLGIDKLRFLRPVRPGDQLTAELQVESATVHPKNPGLGVVRVRVTTRNQAGQAVLSGLVDLGFARQPVSQGAVHA